jgi:catechol 2,3-dioxygenase-like lactoylglutathione lyase family enzyme
MAEGFDSQVTFCYTSDLQSTARFYEDVLGLPLALDQGTCRIYRVAGRAFLGFCRRAEGARPDGVILTLVAKDVDGWARRLSAQGVIFEKPPTFNPIYNIYHCFFRDPNGYLLEIQRFDDPRWPGEGQGVSG